MPAPRFAEDFKDWVEDYANAGNTVVQNNRVYKFNDDIILIMLSLRMHKNGNLLISTDENNKKQLKDSPDEAKQKGLKFFCCAIYDKNEVTKYPLMRNYIMSIECFDYFLKSGQGTMTITSYYDDKIVANTKDIFRISYNGTSVAFIKKTAFATYLEFFDNRPYLGEGVYKTDKIEYRDGKWLENKSLSKAKYPYNLLIHGAPGTGKSSMIQKYFSENAVDDTHFESEKTGSNLWLMC